MSAGRYSAQSQTHAALALHRFGCGPKSGSIAAVSSDPRGALLAELKPATAVLDQPDLLRSAEASRATLEYLKQRKRDKRAQAEQAAAAKADPNSMMTPAAKPKPAQPGVARSVPYRIFFAEAKARYAAATAAELGFVERLVWFWSNHFAVSADKGPAVRGICGAFEREAIRPHVLGKFADMLLAVETHPAMLLYLDNTRSVGPNSAAAPRGRGLNENLAREILELHTLGVRTGYTQDDVTNFAKVITGWTVVPPGNPTIGGEFVFDERTHEPGHQTVLGKVYAEGGAEQGRAVLRDLAAHPATARHVATKLAVHFVADEPPPALAEMLAKRFLETQGDLLEVSKALVTSDEAWQTPRTKLKRPSEWIVAAMRAYRLEFPDVRRLVVAQALLGEPLWQPGSPKGFADDSASWLDGLSQRLDTASVFTRNVADSFAEPDALVDALLGPLASSETRSAVKRAESRQQALTLLLMAPEFQMR